jgi:hypothetical protein
MPSRSQSLRETNQRLNFWLESLVAPNGEPVVVSPAQMAALLSELLQAGGTLRLEPLPAPGIDPEFDRELAAYRRHVERLRDLLPSLHRQLLAERSRLEAQRSRVQSAAQWARASRQTL